MSGQIADTSAKVATHTHRLLLGVTLIGLVPVIQLLETPVIIDDVLLDGGLSAETVCSDGWLRESRTVTDGGKDDPVKWMDRTSEVGANQRAKVHDC